MTELQQSAIREIFGQYQDVVRPMIVAIEVDDVEYPIEIFNEIRAIMNHLAACTYWDISNDSKASEKIDIELHNAQSHLKRAIYDCYKYSCVSVDDYYKAFSKRLKHIDLSVIDNGEFVGQLCALYDSALQALKEAKYAEHDVIKKGTDEPFNLFQIAYERYEKLREFLSDSMSKVERTRRKQIGQGMTSIAIGVVGVVLSAVGVILTILSRGR